MKTIFDFKHLNDKKDTYFLNTQCMPIVVIHIINKTQVSEQIECQIPLLNSSRTMFTRVALCRNIGSTNQPVLLSLMFLERGKKVLVLAPRYAFQLVL